MRWMILVGALALVGCDSAAVREAKQSLERKLKDAGSVQYEDVSECPTKGMITGRYDAKNSFGAFGGFESFVSYQGVAYTSSDASEFDSDLPVEDQFFTSLLKACYGKGKPETLTEYLERNEQRILRSKSR